MYYAQFLSHRPLDDLPRALDELRRIGFALDRVAARLEGAARTAIRIEFRPAGPISPENYLARIARLPGVQELEGGPAEGPFRSAP